LRVVIDSLKLLSQSYSIQNGKCSFQPRAEFDSNEPKSANTGSPEALTKIFSGFKSQ
jgi:hypothetical protein